MSNQNLVDKMRQGYIDTKNNSLYLFFPYENGDTTKVRFGLYAFPEGSAFSAGFRPSDNFEEGLVPAKPIDYTKVRLGSALYNILRSKGLVMSELDEEDRLLRCTD